MQAVVFTENDSESTLHLSELPLPQLPQSPNKADNPENRSVRVKISSIGLNRADTLFPQGRYFFKPVFTSLASGSGDNGYCRLGFEGAGVIDAVNKGSAFKVGDRVAILPLKFDVSKQGCLAEYGIYDESILIPSPESVSDELTGAIWMQYLTAWGGLVTDGQLQESQTVVITAASSSVGIAAIQIAKMLGATAIATTTSDEKVLQLKALGADHVINMKTDDYVENIKAITHNKGTDLVFDAVAGPATRGLVQGSARGGKIIIQGMLDRRPMDIHAGVLMKRLLTVKGFTLDLLLDNPTQLKQAIEHVTEGLNNGKLKPIIAKQFPINQFEDALLLLKSNKHTGKIVVNP